MRRAMKAVAVLGLAAVGILGGSTSEAKAQGFIVGGYFPTRAYVSTHRHHHGCGHHGYGYGQAYGFGPAPTISYQSSAVSRGYREGEMYIRTGRLPHHRMSPAEARGFVAGEQRALGYRPW